jgi:hypothetical protein
MRFLISLLLFELLPSFFLPRLFFVRLKGIE